MKKTPISYALAILNLGFSYLLFTEQQYFSAIAMLTVFALASLSVVLFLLSYYDYFDRSEKGPLSLLLFFLVSLILIFYEVTFDSIAPPILSASLNAVFFVSLGVAISTASIYGIGIVTRDLWKRADLQTYLMVLLSLLIVAVLAYESMYGFSRNSWNGVDELAYNYYASYLFLHGANPYTQSMQYILNSRSVFPTVLLNGSYEYSYDYPALSFLIYVPITALGITSFYSFVFVLIFLSIISSFTVYWKSGFNKHLLVPLAAWLALSFSLVSVSNTFLAISIFLLFAYLFKERPVASGVLMGLAASTTQVAWFALPFFFVLTYRQQGKNATMEQIASSIAVFLLINSYFIAVSPEATIGNIFALFGSTKLPFYGPNIMQFFVSFYSVPYYYTELVSGMIALLALALLYFYTKSAKAIIALVPAFIFFLSWRNVTIYAIPYVPLLLLLHYHVDELDKKDHDILKTKKPIAFAALAIGVVSLVALVYAHSSYSSSSLLRINSIIPIIYVQNSSYYPYGLGGVLVNITNNNSHNEVVSFLIASRSPNDQGYVLGSTLSPVASGSSTNRTIPYRLPAINNSTKLFIVAFSEDYITSKELDISINYHPNSTQTNK